MYCYHGPAKITVASYWATQPFWGSLTFWEDFALLMNATQNHQLKSPIVTIHYQVLIPMDFVAWPRPWLIITSINLAT